MNSGTWKRIEAGSPTALLEARLQLYWAAQVVASAGESFVLHREATPHSAMPWLPDSTRLIGVEFANS